jgi:hypothetical protein
MSTRRLSVVSVRDGLFNLKGGGDVAEKNILLLVEEKKNLIQSFCHIT